MKRILGTALAVLAFVALMSSCSNDPTFESVVQQVPPPPPLVWDEGNWNEVVWE